VDNETNEWKTGCGKRHWMGHHLTPIGNGFESCPYCSKRLAQNTAGFIPRYDHYYGPHVRANMTHMRKI
jgi:hypothetical protein